MIRLAPMILEVGTHANMVFTDSVCSPSIPCRGVTAGCFVDWITYFVQATHIVYAKYRSTWDETANFPSVSHVSLKSATATA